MVDADTVIAVPGAGLIVPERVMPRSLHPRAEGFGKSQVQDTAKGGAAFGAKQRVLAPGLGALGILGLRDDVVIARHQRRFLGRHQLGGAGLQPLHPAQLVVVFAARHRIAAFGQLHRIAIGQVQPAQAQRLFAHHRGLDPARLLVAVVARQPARDILERQFGQDRHPVEPLLPVGFHVIAAFFEHLAGKAFVHRLDFLQQRHIGLRAVQPCRQRLGAGLDPVDVERGDLHVRVSCAGLGLIYPRSARRGQAVPGLPDRKEQANSPS